MIYILLADILFYNKSWRIQKIIKKQSFTLKQPHIRAKIIGITLIIIGIIFIIINTSLFIKLGFSAVLIGLITIFLITEKTIPKNISDAQIEGNLDTIKTITKNLNLSGKAIFLPAKNNLTEERIFIPLEDKNQKIPEIDNEYVFSTGADGKSLGISIPPSGMKLLKEIEKQTDFKNIKLEDIEEPLQTFVGMNLFKKITFEKEKNYWELNLEKPIFCHKDPELCSQYPCPSCSAVITAITKASGQKIQINKAINNGKKTTFHLKIEEKKK